MKFLVTYEVQTEIEVDAKVVAEALTEDWQSSFYPMGCPEDVAAHLAYNLLRNGVTDIRQLDGFAHLNKDDMREVGRQTWELADCTQTDLPTEEPDRHE